MKTTTKQIEQFDNPLHNMKRSAQHSPLPWKVTNYYGGPFKQNCIHCGKQINDQPGYVNIVGDGWGIASVNWLDKADEKQQMSNAAFIVEACNNYERVKAERDLWQTKAENWERLAMARIRSTKDAEAQREELLAAAKKFTQAYLDYSNLRGDKEKLRYAETELSATISKAEKSAK